MNISKIFENSKESKKNLFNLFNICVSEMRGVACGYIFRIRIT